MSSNQAQIDYWSGPGGQRWAQHQVALDRALRPFGEAVLVRVSVRAGERVLDVGCGCGDTTLALGALVKATGAVCGVDVSATLLERARARAAGLGQLRFLEADAAVHRFEAPFDLVFSRFGVMFFADPTAAFANLRKALSARGRLGFVCWRTFRENPWASVPVEVVRSVLTNAPGISDDDGPGPYAFADRDKVEGMLVNAGFRDIELERFDAELVLSTTGLDDAVVFAISAGPAARLLVDAPREARELVQKRMSTQLARHAAGERVALRGSSWVVTARRI
jgi:SAM-dependent methyltransferase